ncbi:outer membrane beta-barrel protein [Pseudorhodoferax sp. Leaf267]|uniref:outer membrane beta-barrel protein n=1 Tax=Pseudorhodoferax sp. Leaf267 TaxID=1736316 RepID=UPI0006F5F935|nr:outer membrane beta-barrel protein [Pseudorhodoferax sp. Leaf267]KQP13675.1 hypothetical protein ASF43_17400 [Pseudorhodoferax sp. Leaf267]
MNTEFRRRARHTLPLALALGAGAASAQSTAPAPEPRVWLQVSAYRPNVDSNFRLDRTDSPLNGTDIDGESDLGLARHRTVPAVLLGLRISERWRAEFEYLSLNRSSSTSVADIGGITFGDGQFNADIDARLRTHTYRLAAGYSFLRDADKELGVVVGAHVTDMLVSVSGAAIVNGQAVGAFTERRSETLPAPTLGVYGSYRFGSNWQLDGRVDFFKLRYRDYSGRLLNMQANALYRVTPNIGVGVGWRRDDLRVEGDGSNFSGELRYRFNGPQLFVRAGF